MKTPMPDVKWKQGLFWVKWREWKIGRWGYRAVAAISPEEYARKKEAK